LALDVYNAHKRDIDLSFQVVTADGEFVDLEIGMRCYLTATALIDTKMCDVSEIDFEVEQYHP
jgi:hypothetical protein